jgi:lipopolysaccharide export system permease protein
MLKKYLFTNFSSSFFPIFLTLFSITSIIFLVKIASLTSIIQLNFLELVLLYSYTIPKILFFTLPIAFVVGMVMMLSRLSGEYELLVISSFGKNPISILKYFIPISIVLSMALLIISEVLIPKANFLNNQFISIKKNEAQFNIKASQFGQEFGPWLIFIEKESKNKEYINVKLLNKDSTNKKFILAKSANITNIDGNLNMSLYNGKSFLFNDNIEQIDFKTMIMSNSKKELSYNSFTSISQYWASISTNIHKAKEFAFKFLVSIFPFISLIFILIFGYYNPRYEKNKATLYSSILIIVFFVLSKKLVGIDPYIAIVFIPIVWLLVSYILFTKTIKRKY